MTGILWWRDDDAGRDHPNLQRLLDLAVSRHCPVALAVVPTWLEPAAVRRIRACPLATVLVHGIAHADYGGSDERKIELGGTADRAWLLAQLAEGRQRLADAFGPQFVPALAPPWNRMDPALLPSLPSIGLTAVSMYGEPPEAGPPRRVDVHLDAMDWAGTGRPRPFAELASALEAGARQGPHPFGLMTHHLVVDETGWNDLDRLLRLGQDDLAARWASAREVFPEPEGAMG